MNIVFRRATATDQAAITALIRAAGINPMSLKWQHFLLAVEEATGAIAGTGQIRTHGDGSRELASIATRPEYQRRGVAGEMVRRLIAQHRAGSVEPLYLTCASPLRSFYEPFGFRVVERAEMPRYFRRLSRVAGLIMLFTDRKLLVMKLEGPA
jgi:N-acetylglutamate synthase-like GNAT family acetyltransferase